ncbi:hypothetical protein BU16DRAFT_556414 [Lophium mytilinum]|uniref:Uncharacterized protein n=1 Tax=Lophium mytilinum TaxID=390894 RepID=A0A6A6R6E4_9PEZI|nr:hypothetical protein BU16DRAFT_556414 [Lophium mytilinum]
MGKSKRYYAAMAKWSKSKIRSIPEGVDFILRLPDELLEEILILSTPRRGSHFFFPRYQAWLNLLLVCKRISRIVHPLLYEVICFGYNEFYLIPRSKAMECFYRSLRGNPKLALLCKHVEIHLPVTPDLRDLRDCINFLELTNPKKAVLIAHTIPKPDTWVMQAMWRESLNRSAVSELVLHTPNLSGLFSADLPHLRTLRIFGRANAPRGSTSLSDDDRQVLRKKRGTSPITTLELVPGSHDADFAVYADLLAWPTALEHFECHDDVHVWRKSQAHVDMEIFRRILEPQRASLRSLCVLFNLPDAEAMNLDFSWFPVLEKLRVAPRATADGPGHVVLPPMLQSTGGRSLTGWKGTTWSSREAATWEWCI